MINTYLCWVFKDKHYKVLVFKNVKSRQEKGTFFPDLPKEERLLLENQFCKLLLELSLWLQQTHQTNKDKIAYEVQIKIKAPTSDAQ